MITCPNPSCGQTLPDWVETCQFCGADVGRVRRPHSDDPVTGHGISNSKIIGLFYTLCAVLFAGGILGVASTFMGVEGIVRVRDVIYIAIYTAQTLAAIGLVLKLQIAWSVANVIAWFNILGSAAAAVGAVIMLLTPLAAVVSPVITLILCLSHVINVAANGAMIWILGETDPHTFR